MVFDILKDLISFMIDPIPLYELFFGSRCFVLSNVRSIRMGSTKHLLSKLFVSLCVEKVLRPLSTKIGEIEGRRRVSFLRERMG